MFSITINVRNINPGTRYVYAAEANTQTSSLMYANRAIMGDMKISATAARWWQYGSVAGRTIIARIISMNRSAKVSTTAAVVRRARVAAAVVMARSQWAIVVRADMVNAEKKDIG